MSSNRNQRYFSRKKNHHPDTAPSGSIPVDKATEGTNNRSSFRKKFFSKNHRPRSGGNSAPPSTQSNNTVGVNIHKLFQRYDQLAENYLKARGKYFELFDRIDPKQKNKLQQNFYHALEEMRKFEASLSPWQQERFSQRFASYQEDTLYSQTTGANLQSGDHLPPSPSGLSEDPHVTHTQQNRPHYQDDQEESMGTIADYQRLKGIDPVNED